MAPDQDPNQSDGQSRRRPNGPVGGSWLWLVLIFLLLIFLWYNNFSSQGLYWSEFYTLLSDKQLTEVVEYGDTYQCKVKDRNTLKEDLKAKVKSDNSFFVRRLSGNNNDVQKMLNE